MADSARAVLTHKYPGLSVQIEVVKEPDHAAVGIGTGIM